MEPDQVDVFTTAVLGRVQQLLHTAETRFAGQIIGNIRETNSHDRIHDDLPLVHAVTTAHPDVEPHPDADAAPDPPTPNSFAKTFREHHVSIGWSRSLAAESFAEPDFNQFGSAKFNRLLETVNDETIRTVERERRGIVV